MTKYSFPIGDKMKFATPYVWLTKPAKAKGRTAKAR
jgi:hypothetical protein